MHSIDAPFTDEFKFGINMTPNDGSEATSVDFTVTGHANRGQLVLALQQLRDTMVVPMAQANVVAETEEEFYSVLTENGSPTYVEADVDDGQIELPL